MSNPVRDHIATLSDEDVLAIIRDYETLDETGSVGDGPLRECIAALNIEPHGMFHQWTQIIALECYRRQAERAYRLRHRLIALADEWDRIASCSVRGLANGLETCARQLREALEKDGG